ncbi:AcrR family transcriptional regulator [Mumia flava]|uniref:AcrR family transcriptional regulator n=1 Tax=Mumia flava TaxID=1348852 RepID=A0A0B2BUU4_9ACTN|nr:TetR/AcrR family transcriptional regulator [Mumia flava]PJJ58082.1 AcrR family transcriptional regulator [Mumia flava]
MAVRTSGSVTRAQRQAQTRAALVETARRLFLDEGYGVTTLDRVALEAGYSKGAVYSNFKSKEELGLAVLDQIHAEMVTEVMESLAGAETYEGLLAGFGGWLHRRLGQPRWTALEVEFAAVVRQSPYVATELATRHRQIRGTIAEVLRSLVADAGVRLALSPEQTATALLSLGIGMGAQRSLDADVDVEAFTGTMRTLLLPPAG